MLRSRLSRVSRPSCVYNEMVRKMSGVRESVAESVLGNIHLDLAHYHEACRFQANIQDKVSSHFHSSLTAFFSSCVGNQTLLREGSEILNTEKVKVGFIS